MSEQDDIDEFSRVIVGMAATYDLHVSAFSGHDIALRLPDLDRSIEAAREDILRYIGGKQMRGFVAELLDAASFTHDAQEPFRSALFALPLSGDPATVSRSVRCEDRASSLGAAVSTARLCAPSSLVKVFPFPVYPSEFSKLGPGRLFTAARELCEIALNRRSITEEEFYSLLGIFGDGDGGECLLLGIEVRLISPEGNAGHQFCVERTYEAEDYSRWRKAVEALLAAPSREVFAFAPERVTMASVTLAEQRALRLLDSEISSAGISPANQYDSIQIDRHPDRYELTASTERRVFGPVKVDMHTLIAHDDHFLERLAAHSKTTSG